MTSDRDEDTDEPALEPVVPDPSIDSRQLPASDQKQHAPTSNLEAALQLAQAGIFVFPSNAEKRPLVKWLDESTTDLNKIKAWWRQFPNALPAIDVGKSGLVVIDADRHGGPDGVQAFYDLLEKLGIDVSACPVVRTPSGGLHFYFKQPSEN